MTPDKLREAGTALYGPLWQSQLARDLGVNDRTVRRWAAGKSRIPEGIDAEIQALCSERIAGIADIIIRPELLAKLKG